MIIDSGSVNLTNDGFVSAIFEVENVIECLRSTWLYMTNIDRIMMYENRFRGWNFDNEVELFLEHNEISHARRLAGPLLIGY